MYTLVLLHHAHIWQLVHHEVSLEVSSDMIPFQWPQVFKQLRPDPSIMQALLGRQGM